MSEKKVLLVEDDEALRYLGTRQCAKLGVTCHTVSSGAQAVEMAKGGYDLILMDLGLPDIDGIEAAARIRAQESETGGRHTPIVAMTAYSERDKCLSAGMDDFLLKPILLKQLQAVVREYVA